MLVILSMICLYLINHGTLWEHSDLQTAHVCNTYIHSRLQPETPSMTQSGLWIIGYGSLIFKPPPLYAFRVVGTLNGYIRRFWQSSSDHRGTPQAPGRVVTLVSLEDLKENPQFHDDVHEFEFSGQQTDLASLSELDLTVWCVAYYIEPKNVDEVKEYMDVREQDGYSTHTVHFNVHEAPDMCPIASEVLAQLPKDITGELQIESTVYIGTIQNESFVGPESLAKTAEVIRTSKGPSGKNIEYLRCLTEAVLGLDNQGGSHDPYLEQLLERSW